MNADNTTPPRPFLAMGMLFVVPLVVGSIIAPLVFNAFPWIADHVAWLESLEGDRFERVASRCVQIAALFMLFPAIRMAGLSERLRVVLSPDAGRGRDLWRGGFIGCSSMALLYAGGRIAHAYGPDPDAATAQTILIPALAFLVGAVFIGFFEETFFRGVIFGTLRQRLGFWPAAVLGSALFSSVHFMRPLAPERILHAEWFSGFALLPHLFARFRPGQDWAFMLTLFLMGLALCGFYERRGNLFFVIGLHGGWVWAMRLGEHVLDRNHDVLPFLFGPGDFISKAPLAILLILLFLLASLPRGSRPIT